MADHEDTKRSGSCSHRGERKLIDVASFLSRTGPLTVKPMENIMFEIDTSSSQRKTVIPKIEQTNHQHATNIEVNQQEGAPAPSQMDFSCHVLTPSKIEKINRYNKNGFGTSISLGSFTIAQLDVDRVKIPKTEREYNPGVLQGNWFYERTHPKYKPIHHAPLNNFNLEYRSIYKDAFINHNQKGITSVMPIKKDNSLPPWVVKEDVKKSIQCVKSAANKQAAHSGHKSHTREADYGGKDPYKGHDLDPFKRRDECRRGYEYKLDAFQVNPSHWDRYGGRENYFKRKDSGNRYSHDETTEIQGNSPPESERTTRAQQALETSQGVARPQTSGMDQRGKPTDQYARPQQASGMNQRGRPTDQYARHQQTSGMNQGGRPTDQYARLQQASGMDQGGRLTDQYARPQSAHGISHMDTIRHIESELANMKISTEYKANFKAKETIAITAASKRKERNLALFAAGRNVSTFAF